MNILSTMVARTLFSGHWAVVNIRLTVGGSFLDYKEPTLIQQKHDNIAFVVLQFLPSQMLKETTQSYKSDDQPLKYILALYYRRENIAKYT